MDEEDSPLSPNHEEPTRNHKWLMLVFKGIIIVFVVSALAALSSPMVIRSKKRGPLSEATFHTKQIGLVLNSFEDEYGSYPNESTLGLVNENNTDSVYDCSGKSSNASFRQFMKAGITESESLFYANIKGSIKPDQIIITSEALKKGEVGFSYISGLTSKDDPSTPLILTPLIPGSTKFDPKPFEGKAIILRIDQTTRVYTIAKDGHVYDDKGIDILSPSHPIWKGKAPDIRYPE